MEELLFGNGGLDASRGGYLSGSLTGNAQKLNIFQEELDGMITTEEVFAAIRRMKMGKTFGVDGILSSILRHAADAVGTNKMKDGNLVVEALTLMFNYVFHDEEWPERWAVVSSSPSTRATPGWSLRTTDLSHYSQQWVNSLNWSSKSGFRTARI